jgi:protein-disulfide isomerase
MRFIRSAALALAALLPAAAPAADKPRANWTVTVATGAGGSHIIGNPTAKLKLTEFVSYTCPHCANFHKESEGPLTIAYVGPGKVSVEVRHIVRDPVDLAAALLTNCGDPKQFIRNHGTFLRSQDRWIEAMASASAGQKARWTSGTLGARMKAIASDFRFYQLMEPRGYSRSGLDRCLSDEAMARRLTAQTQDAVDAGVEGTPGFMLNGVLLTGTHDWKSLETQLQARL